MMTENTIFIRDAGVFGRIVCADALKKPGHWRE